LTAPRPCPHAGAVDRLLMIYNADGGLVNGALDLLHKSFSPATYPCRLCDVTYGLFGMKRDWRETIEALPLPVSFLHRDEWVVAFPGNVTALPAILLEQPGGLMTLVSAEDFAGVRSLEALQTLLSARLSEVAPLQAPPGPDRAGP
jgi:hypothetical protein